MNQTDTEFPKSYDYNKVEKIIYSYWQEEHLFSPNVDDDKDPFTVIMPPPNVTGTLHYGHALTTAIEDALIRWNRMKGKSTLWLPGSDHAGIATQVVVEKMLMETIEVRGDENVKKPSAGYGNDSSSTTDSDIDPEEPWILDDSGQTPKVNIGSMTPIMGGVGNQSTPTTNGGFATP